MKSYALLFALAAVLISQTQATFTRVTMDELRAIINKTQESLKQYKLAQRTYGVYHEDWECERVKAMNRVKANVQQLTAEITNKTDEEHVRRCTSLLESENQKILEEHYNKVDACYKIINGHPLSVQKFRERHLDGLLKKGEALQTELEAIVDKCSIKINEACIRLKTGVLNISVNIWQAQARRLISRKANVLIAGGIRRCVTSSFNKFERALSAIKNTVGNCVGDSSVAATLEEGSATFQSQPSTEIEPEVLAEVANEAEVEAQKEEQTE